MIIIVLDISLLYHPKLSYEWAWVNIVVGAMLYIVSVLGLQGLGYAIEPYASRLNLLSLLSWVPVSLRFGAPIGRSQGARNDDTDIFDVGWICI